MIQRIIVDGWSIGEAAAALDVPERVVAAWVAEYRRHGMASLRDAPVRTVGTEIVQARISRPVKAAFRKIWHGLRKAFVVDAAVRPVPLRRSNKEGPR